MSKKAFSARLLALSFLGLLSSGAWAADCPQMQGTVSCLKDECRDVFCVHVATYHARDGISTEITIRSRPARGMHYNLRCIGGQQKEGDFMRCGGSTISVQSCTKHGLFAKSNCGKWIAFTGNPTN